MPALVTSPRTVAASPVQLYLTTTRSGWERAVDARRTSGPSMEVAWVHSIYLGVVANSAKDLIASARAPAESLTIRATLDPTMEVRIPKWYQQMDSNLNEACIFIKPSARYEAGRPFLEALTTETTSIPFSKYLALHGDILQTSRSNYLICDRSAPLWIEGMIFDLMQKSLLQPPILAKYCAITLSIMRATRYRQGSSF